MYVEKTGSDPRFPEGSGRFEKDFEVILCIQKQIFLNQTL